MAFNLLNKNLSPRWSATILAVVILAGGAIGALFVYRPWLQPPREDVRPVETGPLPGPKEPLGAGSVFPPLEAAGWAPGAPPSWGEVPDELVVLDLWALW